MKQESPPEEKPKLTAARRGFTISYKNKTLLSTIDPVTQAERAAIGALKADRTLYFCPSPLLGYGLDVLLSTLDANSAVLCVETNPELFDLSCLYINQILINSQSLFSHPRFALLNTNDGAELCRFIRKTWGSRVFRRLVTVKLSGGWQLDSSYETIAELLQKDIAVDWGNAMTLVKLGRRYIRNALRNLAALDKALPITELSFGSKPVLVLGAGPSLDPLLDYLAKDKLLQVSLVSPPCERRPFALVCVDTCLKPLKERGIVPDLAVVLESQFWNMKDFTGLKGSEINAAFDLSAFPCSASVLNGKVFFFFTPWTKLWIFERLKTAKLLPPALPPLGSVGLTAVQLAKNLGTGPVITAGIDFSFYPEKTHARGTPSHLASLLNHNRKKSFFNTQAVFRDGAFNTLSKSKDRIKSDPALRNYRDLFEQEFGGDSRIMDIEGSGLPLGVKTLSIKQAVAMLTQSTDKANDLPTHSSNARIIAQQTELTEFVKKEKALLLELRDLLTGTNSNPDNSTKTRLETLLDDADYLWAHFPDCAGTQGRRPPASDVAFLKRVRAELDPFVALWDKTIISYG